MRFHAISACYTFFRFFFFSLFIFYNRVKIVQNPFVASYELCIDTRNVRREIWRYCIAVTHNVSTELSINYIIRGERQCFILKNHALDLLRVVRRVAYLMSAGILRVTLLEIQPRLFDYSSHPLLVLPFVLLI